MRKVRNATFNFALLITLAAHPLISAADTVIFYYTRTGHNKTIAEYIHSHIPNDRLEEIKTEDDRTGFLGFITCSLDQLFDRDAAIITPATNIVQNDDTVILCTPIWLQNLSSPARTFLEQPSLKGKTLYLFVTCGGRLKEEKQTKIENWVAEQGIHLKGLYCTSVGGKTEAEIKEQISEHLKQLQPLITPEAE